MSATLTRVDPLTYPGWNDWVKAEEKSSVFHSFEWARVLRESYGYHPHYLIERHNGRFSALLPFMEIDSVLTGRRGVSLPFSDHVDPIIGSDISPPDLVAAATEYAISRGWRYLDFHGGHNLLPGSQPSSEFVGHRLALADGSALGQPQPSASARRNIKKATRMGVEVDITRTHDALNEFYRLHCLTRKRHGLPAQPFRFFQKLYDVMLSAGLGEIVRAVHKGRTLGAAVFLHYGDDVLFKFGASDLRHQHLRMNDLIFGEAIRWFAKSGFRTLDFGRTEAGNRGLRRFKSGWGAEEYPIRYYKYDVRHRGVIRSSERLDRVIQTTFRMMPIPISRAIGRTLYRHLG